MSLPVTRFLGGVGTAPSWARVVLTAVASSVCFVEPVAAIQSIPSPFEFIDRKQESGPLAGYMRANTGRFGYGPKGGPLVGGRWGVELGGPISLEGVGRIIRGERDVVDPGRDEGDRVIGQAPTLMTTADARIKFSLVGARTWHSINPFLVFSGGLAFDLAGSDELDERLLAADRFDFGSAFFGGMGLGSRVFIGESIAARADGVFSLWKLETPPGFSEPERGFANVESSEWTGALSVTVSVMFRW